MQFQQIAGALQGQGGVDTVSRARDGSCDRGWRIGPLHPARQQGCGAQDQDEGGPGQAERFHQTSLQRDGRSFRNRRDPGIAGIADRADIARLARFIAQRLAQEGDALGNRLLAHRGLVPDLARHGVHVHRLAGLAGQGDEKVEAEIADLQRHVSAPDDPALQIDAQVTALQTAGEGRDGAGFRGVRGGCHVTSDPFRTLQVIPDTRCG